MKTVEEILTKIESLDNLEKYQEIIDMIEELPVEQLNSQIISERIFVPKICLSLAFFKRSANPGFGFIV